jgi:hypothetical protein
MVVHDDEMASLIAAEFGFEAELNEQAGFDLFPQHSSNPINHC